MIPPADLLILTIYTLCVVYVFAAALDSLSVGQFAIIADKEFLKRQLEEKNIAHLIDIQFPLGPKYVPEQFRELPVRIDNKSAQNINVDWDECSFTDVDGRSQRLIRFNPTMTEVLPKQAASVIPPGQSLQEKVTAESTLKPDPQTKTLKPAAGLINFAKLKNPRQKNMPPVNKVLEQPVYFYTTLVLRQSEPAPGGREAPKHAVKCQFRVQRLPWTAALSQKPKTVNHPRVP